MTAPSVTLRTLDNNETGIDISVPRFVVEEAPLGGVSILYEISVLTKLELFKTRLHKNEDVVHFSIYKAYREIEDLYSKLNQKYPKAGLPPLPTVATVYKYNREERLVALNKFMNEVSKNIELCHSSTFTKFIGINSQRLPSFTIPNSLLPSTEDNSSENKSGSGKISKTERDISDDLSEVFPKVKTAPKNSQSLQAADLFEEVHVVRKNEESSVSSKSSALLFDDFDDENLFSSKPKPKAVTASKQTEKKAPVPRRKPEKLEKPIDKVDDSQIIIKDRKQGNISLFEEQDLGDYITKDEEALFLVTKNDTESRNKNDLLFARSSETDNSTVELSDNLDDLLNLEPIPVLSKTERSCSNKEPNSPPKTEDLKELSKIKKPVPLPRKKSVGKIDSESQNTMSKPEVMPRKVFLNQSEMSSNSTSDEAAKSVKPPPVAKKPVVPAKPKPPVKPKPAILQGKESTTSSFSATVKSNERNQAANVTSKSNENNNSNVPDDLNNLDILQYIEQQQKILESELSLFD